MSARWWHRLVAGLWFSAFLGLPVALLLAKFDFPLLGILFYAAATVAIGAWLGSPLLDRERVTNASGSAVCGAKIGALSFGVAMLLVETNVAYYASRTEYRLIEVAQTGSQLAEALVFFPIVGTLLLLWIPLLLGTLGGWTLYATRGRDREERRRTKATGRQRLLTGLWFGAWLGLPEALYLAKLEFPLVLFYTAATTTLGAWLGPSLLDSHQVSSAARAAGRGTRIGALAFLAYSALYSLSILLPSLFHNAHAGNALWVLALVLVSSFHGTIADALLALVLFGVVFFAWPFLFGALGGLLLYVVRGRRKTGPPEGAAADQPVLAQGSSGRLAGSVEKEPSGPGSLEKPQEQMRERDIANWSETTVTASKGENMGTTAAYKHVGDVVNGGAPLVEERRGKRAARSLLAGLWFGVFLGLPGAFLLDKFEFPLAPKLFYAGAIMTLAGWLGSPLLDRSRVTSASRAARRGMGLGALAFLLGTATIVVPPVCTAFGKGELFSDRMMLGGILSVFLFGLVLFAWMPLLLGALGGWLLYGARRHSETGKV